MTGGGGGRGRGRSETRFMKFAVLPVVEQGLWILKYVNAMRRLTREAARAGALGDKAIRRKRWELCKYRPVERPSGNGATTTEKQYHWNL